MICKDMKTPVVIVLLSTFEHARKPSLNATDQLLVYVKAPNSSAIQFQ